ncbi:MAG: GNAT family N-acetyltransferase, partial [Bacilli bacterium]|nr:GNAT family N-acetyltransferase [Bacilli bacterium]
MIILEWKDFRNSFGTVTELNYTFSELFQNCIGTKYAPSKIEDESQTIYNYNVWRKRPMRYVLESLRLLLRPLKVDDAEAVFNGWANDKEVTKYLTWNPHPNVE